MSAKRLVPSEVSQEIYRSVANIDALIRKSGFESDLIELVKVRASQINGCAFCLDIHTRDARKSGVSEQKLYVLAAWEECDLFSLRERAALGWTDALTLVATTHADDRHYQPLVAAFNEKEIVDLTFLIGLINLWNRLAIGMRYVVAPEPETRT
ncbi:MAG TPA: carboxymuconolactone decarboxylase family protein [Methylosinus sp.]|jgi:AhpD family alkylhydroperoxidase|uniref:carboxymuconolactone decarboxylase family protein n=1 Tax=Methylosinus sp. TaxID=427 RepID=UPI002F93B5AB